jgi:C1A family cysteine protease
VCGSCWAFSTTQVMSSAVWMERGEYISLSEQQVLDCSWGYGENHACDGGDPDLAIKVWCSLLPGKERYACASDFAPCCL